MVLDQVTQITIYLFTKYLNHILNIMDIGGGVTVGWIILGVGIIIMIINTILSRPISSNIDSRGKKNE